MEIHLYTLLDSRQGRLQAPSFTHSACHERCRSSPAQALSASQQEQITSIQRCLLAGRDSIIRKPGPTIELQRHADDEGIILSADKATDLAIRHAGFH